MARLAPSERFCSDVSGEHGEALTATASRVDHWILIEYHGAWGRDAVDSSRLPAEVKAHLAERADALRPAKVLFIRRREREPPRRIHVFWGSSAPGGPWLSSAVVAAYPDLLGLDFADPGDPVDATRCCSSARTGSTTPAARSAASPCTRRCESSSTKGGSGSARTSAATGSRATSFACPRASTTDASAPATPWQLLEEHLADRVQLDLYRGRSCYSFRVQAAERAVRESSGALGLDELELRSTSPIVFRAGGTEYEVEVAVEHGDLAQLTCNAAGLSRPRRYVARILRESAV